MLIDRFYTVASHMDAFDPLGQNSIFKKQSSDLILAWFLAVNCTVKLKELIWPKKWGRNG